MVTGDHMTNLKNWIPLFTIFLTTKLGRVLTTTRKFRTETLKSPSTSCFNLKRIRWYLNYRNTKVTIRSFIKRFSVKNFAKLLTITFNFFYNTFWWKKKRLTFRLIAFSWCSHDLNISFLIFCWVITYFFHITNTHL